MTKKKIPLKHKHMAKKKSMQNKKIRGLYKRTDFPFQDKFYGVFNDNFAYWKKINSLKSIFFMTAVVDLSNNVWHKTHVSFSQAPTTLKIE